MGIKGIGNTNISQMMHMCETLTFVAKKRNKNQLNNPLREWESQCDQIRWAVRLRH